MGGIAGGVVDYQSINFTNPASYSNITNTIFDIAAEADFRTLKRSNPASKFTSANSYFSYLQLGFPLTTPKMFRDSIRWGMSFGLRPVSKINYKIEKNERLTGIDSLNTLYEGSGGVNQAFIGTALRIKNFSVGINLGYMFGNKDYSTKLAFINDTITYYSSNSANKTNFGGFFVSGGMQYELVLNKDKKGEAARILRLGLHGNLKHSIKASRDDIRETISYDANGGFYQIDSVFEQKDIKGKITFPAQMGIGFSYLGKHWVYGADFEMGNWDSYRYYGQAEDVQNNWMIRAGAQYLPAKENTTSKKYFSFVKYRAGFYYGSDYLKVNKNRPEYGFTLGTGMPLTSIRRLRDEYVVLNTALEIGNRGNKQTNLRENIVRFSVGISMNARWFRKPKYD